MTLAYGQRTVLEDVTMEVRRGEIWFFVGPNGSGKTTLLRAILGLLEPRAGELSLDPIVAPRELIGFVPQRCDLNPTLPTTVREFVLLGLVGLRVHRRDERERLAWALAKVGLAAMARRNYWALSGGQRQRALVARTLIRRPSLLILDEATTGLDVPTTEEFLHTIAELNRADGLTILFVTHDLTLATRHATHVALFAGGRVTAGPGRDVLNPENLQRAYGVPVEVGWDR
ncbi:MAG: ABC transporter ATP-binding protein [candidate division NC10 bacterium]|nr:ABC transporter ATP-binding protein [candidate division NC10 bacterium]